LALLVGLTVGNRL